MDDIRLPFFQSENAAEEFNDEPGSLFVLPLSLSCTLEIMLNLGGTDFDLSWHTFIVVFGGPVIDIAAKLGSEVTVIGSLSYGPKGL